MSLLVGCFTTIVEVVDEAEVMIVPLKDTMKIQYQLHLQPICFSVVIPRHSPGHGLLDVHKSVVASKYLLLTVFVAKLQALQNE